MQNHIISLEETRIYSQCDYLLHSSLTVPHTRVSYCTNLCVVMTYRRHSFGSPGEEHVFQSLRNVRVFVEIKTHTPFRSIAQLQERRFCLTCVRYVMLRPSLSEGGAELLISPPTIPSCK